MWVFCPSRDPYIQNPIPSVFFKHPKLIFRKTQKRTASEAKTKAKNDASGLKKVGNSEGRYFRKVKKGRLCYLDPLDPLPVVWHTLATEAFKLLRESMSLKSMSADNMVRMADIGAKLERLSREEPSSIR
jgi:hypothetical protein